MKLLTTEIINKLPKLYSTKKVPFSEKEIVCKIFNPCSAGTWFVIEGEEQDDDFIFFGLVDLHEKEFGYFSLNELQSVELPFGLRIERDINFVSSRLSNILRNKAS